MVRRKGRWLDRTARANQGPSIFDGWSTLKGMRRRALSPLFALPDIGLPGLVPLRLHLLICGFPRSGTTLLQLMLENALPAARRFGREIGGWRAATYCWRNHPVLISKVPHDLFRLQPPRNFYRNRQASLRIILMLRDPRDVLTSVRRVGGPPGYVVGADRWRRFFHAYLQERHASDVLEVRYENLVGDTAAVQQSVEQFAGEPMRLPFTEFHTVARPDFDTSTLNGLRPLERRPVPRWSLPEHRARIEQVVAEIPELPRILIDMGYERDSDWMRGATSAAAASGGRLTGSVLCDYSG